ncbi:putative minus-end-directed kinesin ATPase [Helianthus anomalus]
MKHSKPSRNQILREIPLDTPPSNPSPIKQPKGSNRKHKFSKENDSPHEIGSVPDSSPSPAAGKLKSPLPPRPPPSNALKRKLSNDFGVENGVSGSDDTGVKVLFVYLTGYSVIVRVRPTSKNEEEGEVIVQKTSDATCTQVDIFCLVGAPLVENCLAGFKSSVFAYGQTGSGKTYTVWGPANALLENELSSDQQGLTPRVFERLFTRISENKTNMLTNNSYINAVALFSRSTMNKSLICWIQLKGTFK